MYFASTFRRCLLLLFAKIDKFYTRLVTLTSSVFVLVCSSFLSVGLSVCCCWFVLAVFEFCVLAVGCVELRKREEVVMVKSALFSLTLKGGEEPVGAEEIGLRLVSVSREGTRLLYSRERCPVGSLIVGAR